MKFTGKTLSKFAAAAILTALTAQSANAEDLLIKLASPMSAKLASQNLLATGLKSEVVIDNWIRVQGNVKQSQFRSIMESSAVEYVQPNYKIHLMKNPSLQKAIQKFVANGGDLNAIKSSGTTPPDNPPIPAKPVETTGADPLFKNQWGMIDIGVQNAWKVNPGKPIIVAVIDTGVDYTHEDLVGNMWRNEKEIPDNGIDDDNNGYIDDIVGWDFSSNDNKPYDLGSTDIGDLFNGKNPGHGTHCAGNVAAVANNGKGVSGVAPNAKIMALRFIGFEGGGTTADAVKAIHYAVDNGAKVLSNSWGSEGEDPADDVNNKALRDSIQYAMDHDVLFVAAAANSGKDNDNVKDPAYPATYPYDNIISVAAVDSKDALAGFSNYGKTTVDLGAPGVKIFSTTFGNHYTDTLIPLMGATWDGTSMACPHVAGAAALYWSAHPEKHWKDVKDAILNSVKRIPSLEGKTLTGGKLNVEQLMHQ